MTVRTIVANAIAIQRFSCETRAERDSLRETMPIIARNNEAYPSFFAAMERKVWNDDRSRCSIAASVRGPAARRGRVRVCVSPLIIILDRIFLRTRFTTVSDRLYTLGVRGENKHQRYFVPNVQYCRLVTISFATINFDHNFFN